MYSTWRKNFKLFTTHLLTAAIIFSSLGGVINAQKLADRSEIDVFKDAPEPEITAACSENRFVFEGDDSDGPDGNIRTFNSAAMSVRASAFSRRVDNGQWQTGFLGIFGPGLGVTDQGEGTGGNGSHRVDNIGDRKNYVLLEFNTLVAVDKVFLDSVEQDSDITVWIGTANDPYNNHLTLSDAVLSGFGPSEDNDTSETTARNADINSALEVGNVIVIAASTSDTTPDDQFKLHYLDVKCPTAQPPCAAGDMKTTGNSPDDGPDGNVRTFSTGGTVSAKARAFSRRKSDGLWETAFLGAFATGVGVTDVGETAADKKVDNNGNHLNYVVFEFNQNVVVDEVYLDGISGDSDITVWVGTANDPYNNPITPSDPKLLGFGAETNNAPDGSPRWADINAAGESGNVLIIAAKVNETNDTFTIEDLRIDCPQPKAQVTIIKEVFNVQGGTNSTVSFGFTATNLGTGNFSLVDNNVVGPDRFANLNITQFGSANAITVTESNAIGWTLSDVSCVETGIQNTTTSLANKKATIVPEPGESIVCTFRNSQLAPSSATAPISGRAITVDGAGISRAVLTLTNVETGETKTATTNHFGYFHLEAAVGSSYLLAISHKTYFFADNVRTFTLMDELSGIEFVQSF